MRIGVHVTLMILGEVSGFILGVLVTAALLPEQATPAEPFYFLVLCAAAVAGALGARWFFRRVGARCPRCGGLAIPRGVRPIAYHCRECGSIQETRLRSNW